MKNIRTRGKFAALCSLVLIVSIFWSLTASTSVTTTNVANTIQESESTSLQNQSQLAKNLTGECRAANRLIDIFSSPTVSFESKTLATLEPDQQVTLFGQGAYGWIQVSSPVRGYVIARYLKLCDSAALPAKPQVSSKPEAPPRPRTPAKPEVSTRTETTAKPEASPRPQTPTKPEVSTSEGKLCQTVKYTEGLAIRREPNLQSQRLSGLAFNTRIKLSDPPDFRKIDGRGWTKISEPTAGWVTTGRPEGNLSPRFSCN